MRCWAPPGPCELIREHQMVRCAGGVRCPRRRTRRGSSHCDPQITLTMSRSSPPKPGGARTGQGKGDTPPPVWRGGTWSAASRWSCSRNENMTHPQALPQRAESPSTRDSDRDHQMKPVSFRLTFTFSHLADAFIQSDLQLGVHKAINLEEANIQRKCQ